MKIINMTKERSPGSLAHEWGHGLDNCIHGLSTGYDTIYCASEGLGKYITEEVRNAYDTLIKAMLEGDGTNTCSIKVLNRKKNFRRVYNRRRRAVQTHGLSLDVVRQFADRINSENLIDRTIIQNQLVLKQEKQGYIGSGALVEKLKKIETKRELNSLYQELMYHHYSHTGEYAEYLEVPIEDSSYLNRMRELDDGKKKLIIPQQEKCLRDALKAG